MSHAARAGLRGPVEHLPFDQWLPRQRWYGGRTRELRAGTPQLVVPLEGDLDLVLLDVDYADGPAERYQVLVRWEAEGTDGFGAAATIGAARGPDGVRVGHDALHDPAAARRLMTLIDRSAEVGPLQFTREPD